jgi:hypothetical protein
MKCSELYCPWIQSPTRPNRYVCLKCGKTRRIDDRLEGGIGVMLSALLTAVVLVLLL